MANATEMLRKLLDERGVEYEAYRDIKNRSITKWRTYHGAFVFFAVEKEGKLFVETASDTEHSAICTPEQAIAATLGSGTLTADDIRDLIERHSDAAGGNGRDFHNGAYTAIADELNATLGSGTCELVETDSYSNDGEIIHVLECSECGETCEHVNGSYPRCPHCGKAVKR